MDHEKVANVLKLLGDKTRLSMVAILKHRECCVCEFLEVFDMSQPSISQHLRKLKDAGILNEKRRSQWVYYSLNPQSEFIKLIESLFDHISTPTDLMKKIEASKATLRCGC